MPVINKSIIKKFWIKNHCFRPKYGSPIQNITFSSNVAFESVEKYAQIKHHIRVKKQTRWWILMCEDNSWLEEVLLWIMDEYFD